MYIDIKNTVWERLRVPDGEEEKYLEKVKSGEFTSLDDFYYISGTDTWEELDHEVLYDSAEQMTPEENNGMPTIEVHSDENSFNDKILWDNGRKN